MRAFQVKSMCTLKGEYYLGTWVHQSLNKHIALKQIAGIIC